MHTTRPTLLLLAFTRLQNSDSKYYVDSPRSRPQSGWSSNPLGKPRERGCRIIHTMSYQCVAFYERVR